MWSIYFLIQKQVCDAYAIIMGDSSLVESKNYSYTEYIKEETRYVNSEKFVLNRNFWSKKLSDLPKKTLYKSSNQPLGHRKSFDLAADKVIELRNFLKTGNYSLQEFFMAVLILYLSIETGDDDVIIGLPIFNRAGQQRKNTIGMFTSTMPFRIKLDKNETVGGFIERIGSEIKQCLRHQKYPYNQMINDTGIAREGFDSLFKVSFNYYNSVGTKGIKEIQTEMEEYYSGYQSYPLQILIKEWSDQITLAFDYRLDDYSDEYISGLYKVVQNIISQIVQKEESELKDIRLLSPEEINNRLYTLNETKSYYPNKNFVELFEEQVAKTPGHIAFIGDNKQYTYEELNDKANGIANVLRKSGVNCGRVVALIGNHSYGTIAGFLGILKMGAAFLPIDPKHPVERVNYMLADSRAALLLTNVELNEAISFDGGIVFLDDIQPLSTILCNLECKYSVHDLAYIIYTSGSTGRPKGVMIEHKSLVNYVWWAKKMYAGERQEIFAFYSSIAFDLTITSIFTPLISGNTIVAYQDDESNFILEKVWKDNKATVVKLTPSHLSLIKDFDNKNITIRKLIVGGENLKNSLAREVHESFEGNIEIFNEYRPTEATVGCMIYKFNYGTDRRFSVPLGKPINNTQLYILDRSLNVTPEGMEGELYISGDCLARGYLMNSEMTQKNFIYNPFIGSLMYKTGDLAKYLENGDIEYCGRKDQQIKLRGYRIELEEIENCLLMNEKVKSAAVLLNESPNENQIISAYITCKEPLGDNELKSWLSRRLPQYMMPSRYVRMDSLPLTLNGKLDQTKLLDVGLVQGKETINFITANEMLLIGVLKEFLRIESIDPDSNFFNLGGDSIISIQLASKLKERGYDISIKDILSSATIRDIGKAMVISDKLPRLVPYEWDGSLPNTPIVEWFLRNEMSDKNHWNQSLLLELDKGISFEFIQQALELLSKHHDSFRLNYNPGENKLFYNHEHLITEFNVKFYDLSSLAADDQINGIKEYGYQIKSSFNIETDLLIKACIFELGPKGQLLLLTIHHLAVDGLSWRIILEDLGSIVEQLQARKTIRLPPKTHSFKNWALGLRNYSDKIPAGELEYWQSIEQVKDYCPGGSLIKTSKKGYGVMNRRLKGTLIQQFSRSIKEIYNMNLNEGLIIALVLSIYKQTKKTDIIIELEHHGRMDINEQLDIARTVGWFTSIYPALFRVKDLKMEDTIKSLKNELRSIPSNGFNYSILKFIKNELNTNGKNYIRFNYMGDFTHSLNTKLFNISAINSGLDIGEQNYPGSVFDINVITINHDMDISVIYNTLYEDETIEYFIDMYIKQIEDLCIHCTMKQNIELTVSDFDGLAISQEDLDSLFS